MGRHRQGAAFFLGALPLTHDVPHRHRAALDPSAITNIGAGLHVVGKAIADCKRAGRSAEDDPAVLLFVQHLGTMAARRAPEGEDLRVHCMKAIGEIEAKPSLQAMAAAHVAEQQADKTAFHKEANAALKRLANAFGYDPDDYDLSTDMDEIAAGGDTILHSDELYLRVSPDDFGFVEVMFRRCEGRSDQCGMSNNWAALAELDNPRRLAARIRRQLGF